MKRAESDENKYTFIVEETVNGYDVAAFANRSEEDITAFAYIEEPNTSTDDYFKSHTDRVTLKFSHNESAADYGFAQISSPGYVQRQLDAALI